LTTACYDFWEAAAAPLAGQRARIRLDGQVMHVITQDGILWRTLPDPARPAASAPGRPPRWTRPAARTRSDHPARVSSRGGIQVARQRVQVGLSHAGQTVTIQLAETTVRVFDQHGEVITTVPRNGTGEVCRFKAYGTAQPANGSG
jgi:hypothetical protein